MTIIVLFKPPCPCSSQPGQGHVTCVLPKKIKICQTLLGVIHRQREFLFLILFVNQPGTKLLWDTDFKVWPLATEFTGSIQVD